MQLCNISLLLVIRKYYTYIVHGNETDYVRIKPVACRSPLFHLFHLFQTVHNYI